MRNLGFTKQERAFVALMRFWMIAFLGVGIIFAISPNYIPDYVTRFGVALLDWHDMPPVGENGFFVVLSVAFLFALAYLCAIVQHAPVRNIGYTRPVIFSKFVTSLGFFICFLFYGKHFLYLVSAMVDFTIFILTWWFYAKAVGSRS